MLKQFKVATFATLMSIPTYAASEPLPTGKPPIIPATNVEGSQVENFVLSLVTAFQVLNQQEIYFFNNEKDVNRVNFFYASGGDFIIDRRVSSKSLPILSDDATKKISKFDTQSDTCFVQEFRFTDRQPITIAVHNEDGDNVEDVYRCLTVALWSYTFGNIEGIDIQNWRISFRKLLNL